MMDACSDPNIKQVVIMSGAQLGKSEVLLNIIGYHIEHDPSPILLMQPTVDMAQSFSKDRITSGLLATTPSLRGKVKDPRARDSGNTTLHKTFPGGALSLVGANSPASLASRPIRIVLCDEVDRYPVSAGEEGDPVALATKRSMTFWNRKIVLVSTPTDKGASRIESAYHETDMRQYHIPCPHCDHMQTLRWAQVQWHEKDAATAAYYCEECGAAWTDVQRHKAISNGKWVASAPFNGIAGFHISSLYSPWVSIPDAVDEFLKSRRDPMRLKTWINTFLGETWEEQGESIDEMDLMDRRENWGEQLPDDVLLLTAGVDVQDDRLEVEIVGWGRGEESWSIAYEAMYGDPSSAELWNRLDVMLQQKFDHPTKGEMVIRSICVDSGGHYTQQVYNYARLRAGRRVFAIKGIGGSGKPIVGRPSKNNIGKINLFPVGTDTAKEVVYARLKISDEGEGYCHFPSNRGEEYFRMLTAEKKVTRYYKGRPRTEWAKIRTRNEALDCRVYATAALSILNLNLEAVYIAGQNQVSSDEQPAARRRPGMPMRSGFVHGYR
jgi:phage terminase large subunit GpA-like protein